MYHRLLFHVNLFMVWFIHLSIEDDNNLIMKIYNAEHELKYLKRNIGQEIEHFRENEAEFMKIKHQINMQLSGEIQTIDEYLMCRSELYRSIELKILMGELINRIDMEERIHETNVSNSDIMKKCFSEEQSVYAKLVDEYRNKKCRLPVSNNIHDIEVIEYLILKRFYYVRVFNKELFHHQFLWKMLEEMKKQLPN
uniref:Uncharacterized protein n=1 Tax=Schistosoma mansoni TaxID=6183 RepID=A0A5K4FEV2_SCHMA